MKPTKKFKGGGGLKNLLGSLSPAYGMATGRGMFGGDVGLLPMLARRARPRRPDGAEMTPVEEAAAARRPTMRRGGKVKKYAGGGSVTRGDGCVSKGHTKGRKI